MPLATEGQVSSGMLNSRNLFFSIFDSCYAFGLVFDRSNVALINVPRTKDLRQTPAWKAAGRSLEQRVS